MASAEQARKHLETLEHEHGAAQGRLDGARREAESIFESIARSKDLDDKALARLTTARAKTETAAAVVDRLAAEVERARAALAEAENEDRLAGVRALHDEIRAKGEQLDGLARKAKAALAPAIEELAALVARAEGERARLPRAAADLVPDARGLCAWTVVGLGRHPLAVAADADARQAHEAQLARDREQYRREVAESRARLRRPAGEAA